MQLTGGKVAQAERTSAKALRQEQGGNFQRMAEAGMAGAQRAVG